MLSMATVRLFEASMVAVSVAFCFLHSALASSVVNKESTLCSTRNSRLQNQTYYPSDATYKASTLSYFFQQDRLSPSCIVRPTSAADVSFIVTTSTQYGGSNGNTSALAIRSGGHAPVPRAANIDHGATIDLTNMNDITINLDRSSVSVGGGAIWKNIYAALQPMNLTVLGARVADLGVGGFLTGGGISFFSPEKGFACDHILNMEAVLANGSIVNASAHENPDLFTALKGGSNNFGIVTRFDLQTYSHGNFWGGFIFYPGSTAPQQLSAFENFMDPTNADPYAEMICAIGYEAATSNFLVSNGIYYTKPIANPEIFKLFTAIQPQLGSTMRISNMSDFVAEEEAQQAINSRGLYANTVFASTSQILSKVTNLWNTTVPSIKSVAGTQYFIVYQKLPAINPGNSLGLNPSLGPQVLCLLSITWNNAADDALVNGVVENLINAIEQATKAAGVFNKYKYLNYAASFQDPIGGYGNKSVAEMRRVSREYDPQGFFQMGVPGGFKLARSPVGLDGFRSSSSVGLT